jgi:hypothetical protein
VSNWINLDELMRPDAELKKLREKHGRLPCPEPGCGGELVLRRTKYGPHSRLPRLQCYTGRMDRAKTHDKTCEFCGREYVGRKRQRFCSRSCTASATRPVIPRQDWEILASAYLSGPTCLELARLCEVSEEAIRGVLTRVGCPRRPRGGSHLVGSRGPDGRGYVKLKTENGWQLEHRVVMEKKLGRPLSREEFVHHGNARRDDNRVENLEVLDRPGHAQLHHGLTDVQIARLQDLYLRGEPVREICNRVGVSAWSLYKYTRTLPRRRPVGKSD